MLRNRNFLLLFVATLISRAGDSFTFLALAFKIDSLYSDPTESAKALGLVLIAFALPQVVVGLFAGTLVDRWDRRRVMIAVDLARALLVPGLLVLRTTGDLAWVTGLAFAMAAFGVFFYPARTALLPKIVAEDELMTANSWLQVGETIARLSGPILAGVVIGAWGMQAAFTIDSISYLASGLLIVALVGVQTRAPRSTEETSSTWQDLAEGVRYAVSSRLLQGVTIGLALAVLGVGAVDVLFVPFVRFAFDAAPERLGLLMTAQGVGMLVGGLLLTGVGRKLPPKLIAAFTLFWLGVGAAGLGLAPNYWVALPAMAGIGLMLTPLNASLQTIMQQGVPAAKLGRASAVVDMGISLAHLSSMGGAGWVAGLIGLRQTYLVGGFLIGLGALAFLYLLRGVETTHHERVIGVQAAEPVA